MSHLAKFLSRKACRGSTSSRSLVSAANEPPNLQGVYIENDDPLHQATTFPPQPQIGSRKEIEEGVMYVTAKSLTYNKILEGHFRTQVTEEHVNNLVSGAVKEVNAGDSLSVEEKMQAAERGIRAAIAMFTFYPTEK